MVDSERNTLSLEVLDECPFAKLVEKYGFTFDITGFEGKAGNGQPFPRRNATSVLFEIHENGSFVQVMDGTARVLYWRFDNYQDIEVDEEESQIDVKCEYGPEEYLLKLYK